MKLTIAHDDVLQPLSLTDSAFLQLYVKSERGIKLSNLSMVYYNMLLELLNHPKVVFRHPQFDDDWLDDSMLTLHKTNFNLERIHSYIKICEYVIISGINLQMMQYPSASVAVIIDVFTANSEYFKPLLVSYERNQIIDGFLADN